MSKSEMTLFRERQALEEASARLGLDGLAQVADHETINARAQRGATRIMRLVKQGHHRQAIELMNQPGWGVNEGEM